MIAKQLAAFAAYLHREERSTGMIDKYLRDTRAFLRWLRGRPVDKACATAWKAYLLEKQYAPVTVNNMLSSLNSLLRFLGWKDCRAKFLYVQRRLFRDASRELTCAEYARLLETKQAQG